MLNLLQSGCMVSYILKKETETFPAVSSRQTDFVLSGSKVIAYRLRFKVLAVNCHTAASLTPHKKCLRRLG